MQKLMLWSHRYPRLVILLLLGITCFLAYFIPSISVDVSVQMLWSKSDPAHTFYKETVRTFGSDKITVVYLKDSRLFTPKMLARLSEFQAALEGLPDVYRVDSLFTNANLRGEEGFLYTAPFIEWPPETLDEALAIKASALQNPIAMNYLVAENGAAIAFNLFLDENVSPDDETNFSQKIDEVIATIAPYVDEAFQLGTPYTTRMCYEGLLHDQRTVVPLAFLLFSLTTLVIWRSVSLVGLTTLTSGLSILWTLGFMGLSGIPMTLFTAIIPALLIVIGSTEDIHLFSEYLTGIRESGTRSGAVLYMIRKSSLAIFLTALTTFLGFLAIALNDIQILKQFGIACAFGLLANPLITLLLAPAYLKFFGPKKNCDAAGAVSGFVDAFFAAFTRKITALTRTYKRHTFGVLTGGILLIGLFSFNIKLDNDLLGIFKPSSPLRMYSEQLHEELAGSQIFLIHIKSGTTGAFLQPENLSRVADIQDFLRKSGWCDKSTSIVDYLKLTYREMHDGDHAYNRIPDSPDLIAQYLLILPTDEISTFITDDTSEVNIVVRHNISSSHGLKHAVTQTSDFIEQTLNLPFEYHLTGESIISMKAADTLASGQITSLVFTLAVVFVLISLVFNTTKAGLVTLAANILPILFFCGLMGALGIFLNTGTAMVAVIAIGLAVDDTVHFMTRYSKEMRRLLDQDKAIDACIHHEIRPIMATSIGLSLGFGVIMFSELLPLVHFGLLSALTIVCALLVDMFITPILLSSTPLLLLWDLLTLDLQQTVLTDCPLFERLKRWQIKKVVLLSKMLYARPGELIIRQGEIGHHMYLLLEGKVQVEVGDNRDETSKAVLAHIGPGRVFGEIALIDPGPRTADVRAVEDVTYLEFDWNSIERVFRIYPYIAARLYRNLSQILGERLRDSIRKIPV